MRTFAAKPKVAREPRDGAAHPFDINSAGICRDLDVSLDQQAGRICFISGTKSLA